MVSRAFDIGCAVGRSAFELARDYDEVLGMDFSQAFIARCQELKMTGLANYNMTIEGGLVENKTATIDRDIVSYSPYKVLTLRQYVSWHVWKVPQCTVQVSNSLDTFHTYQLNPARLLSPPVPKRSTGKHSSP